MTKRLGKDIISKYHTYIRLEKSLSPNSVDAYMRDLKLVSYAKTENLDITGITYLDLQQFISQLHDIGIHPRSQARILSGIKSFYHFLLIDEYITSDPTELLEAPKIDLNYPKCCQSMKSTDYWTALTFQRRRGSGTGPCWRFFTAVENSCFRTYKPSVSQS